MEKTYREAKEIFMTYGGNRYQMHREEYLSKYEQYHVPQNIEREWYRELAEEMRGMMYQSDRVNTATSVFERLCEIARTLSDDTIIDELTEYLYEKRGWFDTNSIECMVNAMNDVVPLKEFDKLGPKSIRNLADVIHWYCEREITVLEENRIVDFEKVKRDKHDDRGERLRIRMDRWARIIDRTMGVQ